MKTPDEVRKERVKLQAAKDRATAKKIAALDRLQHERNDVIAEFMNALSTVDRLLKALQDECTHPNRAHHTCPDCGK